MWYGSVIIFIISVFFVHHVTSLRMTMNPPRAVYISSDTSQAITCNADKPLSGCQFRINYQDVINFDAGSDSTVDDGYKFVGEGLKSGQCGILIKRPDLSGYYVLGCRVRGTTGNWVYADTSLFVNSTSKHWTKPLDQPFREQETRITLAEPYEISSIKYMWKVPMLDATATCSFQFTGVMETVVKRTQSETNQEGFKIENNNSFCLVKMLQVKREYGGWVWAFLKTSDNQTSFPFPKTTLIVTESPANTLLEVKARKYHNIGYFEKDFPIYDEGDNLTASCQAVDSRPVVKMKWYFDSNFQDDDAIRDNGLIRDDDVDDAPLSEKWVWEFENHTHVQNISRKLDWTDDGKLLTCRISHYQHEFQDARLTNIITVNPAKSQDIHGQQTVSELVQGREALITVNTGAWDNTTRPTFIWRIGNVSIREGQHSHDYPWYSYVALETEQEGDDWIARLVIERVGKQHADQQFLLRAGHVGNRREYLVIMTSIVDLKLWYALWTVVCVLIVVTAILVLIYYKDIRHWIDIQTHNRRSTEPVMMQ